MSMAVLACVEQSSGISAETLRLKSVVLLVILDIYVLPEDDTIVL